VIKDTLNIQIRLPTHLASLKMRKSRKVRRTLSTPVDEAPPAERMKLGGLATSSTWVCVCVCVCMCVCVWGGEVRS
jgi:hypothetical protein